MSVSNLAFTVQGNGEGEAFSIGNSYALTAGHVVFSPVISFNSDQTIRTITIKPLEHSITTYMPESYISAVNAGAAKVMTQYNNWVNSIKIWKANGKVGSEPKYSAANPYGNIDLIKNEIMTYGIPEDSVLIPGKKNIGANGAGLALFYQPSYLSQNSSILNGSSEKLEIGTSARGQTLGGGLSGQGGSNYERVGQYKFGSITSPFEFYFSPNAYPSNSGSAFDISYQNSDYIFGNLSAAQGLKVGGVQQVDSGQNAMADPNGLATGILFNSSDFYTLNSFVDNTTDTGKDPKNLIVGVNPNPNWTESGGGVTYNYAIGTDRRDLFVGTYSDGLFYASRGDTVDVGSGNNVVIFNPSKDANLKTNGNMTVQFGKTAVGENSGNTVVEVDTSSDSQFDYILDLTSDGDITPDNIQLIAGGQSLYWYPGAPGLASPGTDPAMRDQWLDNADVQFLSVIAGNSTITFVDQHENVGIATTAHQGMFSDKGISPISIIKFANGVTWDATKIYEYIKKCVDNSTGGGGVDFIDAYGKATGSNINNDGQFDQYFLPDPLNSAGRSSISTAQPSPALADVSTPLVTEFADAGSDIVVSASSENDPAALYATGFGQTLDPAGSYSSVYGDGGGDTFVFNQGYGSVVIREADTAAMPINMLQLGIGLTAAATDVTADDSGDITLSFSGGDRVTLAGALLSTNGTAYGVQQVNFADGTVWTYADLLAQLETASADNSVLYGDTGANILDGKGVSQTLEGNGGGDTFIFDRGYGLLAIEERDDNGNPNNILKLGSGLNEADATVVAESSGTVAIDFGNGDQIWLEGQLNSSNGITYGVQQIQFADGTIWTEADLVARLDTVNENSATLYGDNMGHTYDTMGADNDVISHGGGDTFIYNLGYGTVNITESDEEVNPANVLRLGSGIAAENTTVTADDSGDLVLNFGGDDRVILVDALNSSGGLAYGVQTVAFADGTTWTYADLLAAAEAPSINNAILYGGAGSDHLDGDGTATTLVGNGGGDTFIYNEGYGALTIAEADASLTPNNSLQIGPGLPVSSMAVTGDSEGDLILSFGGTNTITLIGALASTNGITYGVQQIVFADGTRLSYADLLTLADMPTTNNTTLYGDTSANVLDGGGIAQTLVGGGGSDTFIFSQGYGHLVINEADPNIAPNNVLSFGSGITAANLNVTGDADGDLILDFGSGDQVTLVKALDSDGVETYGIQRADFADGTSINYRQLLALADIPSTSNTTLYGDTGANTLDGEGIAHTLVGNGGDDTFNFDRGYGALTITENDRDFGDTNILQLGSGITAAGTQVSADASGDLILNFGNGDVVTIQAALNTAASTTNGIQQVNFADGTSWTSAQMLALAETGTASNTTLYGDGQGDTFNPDGFARVINSTGNGDIINYARGDGALTINEADTSGEADNSLILGAGLLESDTVVSTDANNDIILSFGSGDTVTLASAMAQSGTTAYGVQNIQFADGTIWSLADLRYQINPTSAGMAVVDGDFAETVNADILDGGGWASGSFDFTDTDTNDFHNVSVDSVAASGTVDPSLTDAQLLALLQANVGSDTSGSDAGSINWAFSGAGAFDYLQADQSVTLDYVVSVSDGQGGELKQNVRVTVSASQSAGSELTLYGSGVTINYGLGRGDLYVNDIAGDVNPNNTLAFGAGIDPSMITLQVLTDPEATAGDLLDSLQLVVAGAGTITLADALSDPTAGVQTVTFADGTVWTYAQMIAMLGIQDPQQYGEAVAVGGTSADTLDPQGTAHIAQGNGGGDTFVYNRGYGALDIIEVDQTSATNTLAFGAGITAADVTVTMSDIDQFKLSLGNGDVVTFEGSGGGISDTSYWDSNAHLSVAVSNAYSGIERVTFADGTVWSIAQLIEQQTADSSGTLYGTEGAGIFNPGGTANTIVSEGTDDQILYDLGDGPLTIVENPSSSNPENTLTFGAGITASMLTVTTDQTNFYISLNGSDQITINNEYGGGAIQNFTFQDGTTLDYAGLMALTGDYYYSEGDGAVTINAANAPASGNILQVYANDGYSINDTPGSVNYAIDASGDLNINFGNGDDLNILHEFNSDGSVAANGIQTIDGFSSAQLTAFWDESRHFNAVSGQTNLDGDGNGGIFDPKGFENEISDTGANVDTIVYDRGYGPLTINDLSTNYSNSILFGPGISLSSLSFTSNADGDLIISLGSSDQITIKNGLLLETPADSNSVQSLVFQDGTTAYTNQGTIYGSDGSTANIDVTALADVTLTGDSSAQFFSPQGLVHNIVGGGGADGIFYEKGDGQLTIDEEDTSGTSSSLLRVFDSDLSLSGSSGSATPDLGSVVGVTSNESGDVTLYFGNGDDVTILGQLAASNGTADGVSEIVAFDATGDTDTWTNTDIQAALAYEATTGTVPNAPAPDAASRYKSDYGTAALQDVVGTKGGSITGNSSPAELDGSAGDETVTAGSAGDLLVGGPGDSLNGGAGADKFAFRSGFGQETINNFDPASAQHDVLQFDSNVFSDWVHLLGATQQQGSDLLITLDASDTITLKNVPLSSFTSSNARFI